MRSEYVEAASAQVGAVDDPEARVLRVVHISDTHGIHNSLLNNARIPPGDILVHSGDFGHYNWFRECFKEWDFQFQTYRMSNFFRALPHRYKIFVPGNHELFFEEQTLHRIQKRMIYATVLQDSGCTIEGLRFYGSGWNAWRRSSRARGYSKDWSDIIPHWQAIPSDTDVVITHIPPWKELGQELVNRIQPLVHLHGHIHSQNGLVWENIDKKQLLHSNSAMAAIPNAHIIDVYLPSDTKCETNLPEYESQ